MGSKKGKGQRFLVGAGVLMLVSAIVVFIVTTSQQNNLSAKVAIARKAGFPFEGKSLDVKPPFPSAKNAAPYYEKAISQYRAIPSRPAGETALSKSGESLDDKERKDLDAFLVDMEPALDFVWQGSQADYCYFPKDWDKGAAVLFPEYASLKQIAKALAVRAQRAATSGDVGSAVEGYATIRTLARHLAEQPTMIALLVSIAVESIRVRSIEAMFPLVLKGEMHSKWMRESIEAMPEQWDLTRMLRTEAFFGWWLTDHLRELNSWVGPGGGGEDWKVAIMSKSQYVARATKSAMLDLYLPAINGYKVGTDEREVLDALDQQLEWILANDQVAGVFVGFGTPMFTGLANALDRARFRRRSLLAALDVLDHKRKTGAWPPTLPVEFIDPYDDKPMRYRIDGDGFRIWSVGEDMSDDGGLTDRESKTGQGDEVFIYPRPKVPMP